MIIHGAMRGAQAHVHMLTLHSAAIVMYLGFGLADVLYTAVLNLNLKNCG